MQYKEVKHKLQLLKEVFEITKPIHSNLIAKNIHKKHILTSYPEFYRTFLEEIGIVYLSHHDQFIFEVTLPKQTNEAWFLDEDFNHNQGLRLIFHTDDVENQYILLDSKNNMSDYSNVNKPMDIEQFSEIICNILDNILDCYNKTST